MASCGASKRGCRRWHERAPWSSGARAKAPRGAERSLPAHAIHSFPRRPVSTARQRELCGFCLDALAAGEARLKAGVPAREVDAAVRGSFAAKGLDRFFPSHSGHGIGLSHPEPPFLVPGSDEMLMAGDVVALEPGLYVPGVAGMRFERNYRVTDEGFEPAVVTVKAGHPVTLLVKRVSDRTCATELVMKEEHIRQSLPLNEEVAITFTPKRAGDLDYACGMDMYRGKVHVE